MLALVGRPSLHGYSACMVIRVNGHPGEIACRQNLRETSFSPFRGFCSVETLLFGGGEWFLSICGLEGPVILVWVLAVWQWRCLMLGGWLTYGDLVLETRVDVAAVVEHRLILARVRSEWTRLRRKGLATVWAPASQDTHFPCWTRWSCGYLSQGCTCLISLPTFATAQF